MRRGVRLLKDKSAIDALTYALKDTSLRCATQRLSLSERLGIGKLCQIWKEWLPPTTSIYLGGDQLEKPQDMPLTR